MTATSPRVTRTRTRWMLRGACRDEDPELFFPISDMGIGADQVRRAVAVCGRCGVRTECLRYALSSRQDHGIWGGFTEQERTAMIRRRQRVLRRIRAHA
jgi:WhiB family transcriptional regulator, redox-sensing transcriptional regulator